MNNIERTTATVNRDLPPLIQDSRAVLADAKKLSSAVAADGQIQRYEQITRDIGAAAAEGKLAVRDARAIIGHVKSGRGTLGALVMDEALYDDLQEMLRDLKHNPWKFFWRE
jgi:phospholipid/cholesterol/gamma-HCH transport system substrate-binding protein